MSENVRKTLQEVSERQEFAQGGNRLVSLAAAIFAVLAALGALMTHNRSIAGLTSKNSAILLQARASDTYNRYEAKLVRSEILAAMIDLGLYRSNEAHDRLLARAAGQKKQAEEDYAAAKALEDQSTNQEVQSEGFLRSYETLEVATALFDISIVLVSISALVRTRAFLTSGCVVSAVGFVLLLIGFSQGRFFQGH